MDILNLDRVELCSDGEPTLQLLKEQVKKRRSKATDITEGSLKDSQNMGAIESVIRWWQVKVRTLRFCFEKRYGKKLTAYSIVWLWLCRHASFLMEK
jgi:hypothetical protein